MAVSPVVGKIAAYQQERNKMKAQLETLGKTASAIFDNQSNAPYRPQLL